MRLGGLAGLRHIGCEMGVTKSTVSAPDERATKWARYVDGPAHHVDGAGWTAAEASFPIVVADHRLQGIPDHRAAIAQWFAAVRSGGHLVLIVPHAFLDARQLGLPVRERPEQRRLYTPASLLDEVEQALVPNSYRVRALFDDEQDGDGPGERGEIVLVLEKLEAPFLALRSELSGSGARPDYAFEPARTRVEIATLRPRRRVLILKLDHLGDFILALPALERARRLFADAHLTLAVGSWNFDLAEGLGLADEVRAFDAFPRNSAHEDPDVDGKRALFEAAFPEEYDVAIDLRTDGDTRTLLNLARAPVRAAIGAKAQFPFLDVALPIDIGRVDREDAREWRYDHHRFHSQGALDRRDHRIRSHGDAVERGNALIWGPYDRLRPGRYLFDPFIEFDADTEGLVMIDVGLDSQRTSPRVVAAGDPLRLAFDVVDGEAAFEFRIWPLEEAKAPPFSFFGGRLVREGAPGTLHQSDYQVLLIELVALRLAQHGLLADVAAP